jgi:hypothetical protein
MGLSFYGKIWKFLFRLNKITLEYYIWYTIRISFKSNKGYFTFVDVSTQIKNILFKKGLPNEIEVIPIADTIAKHRDNITLPHRDSFYNIFWYQKGTATHFVDFFFLLIIFLTSNRIMASI